MDKSKNNCPKRAENTKKTIDREKGRGTPGAKDNGGLGRTKATVKTPEVRRKPEANIEIQRRDVNQAMSNSTDNKNTPPMNNVEKDPCLNNNAERSVEENIEDSNQNETENVDVDINMNPLIKNLDDILRENPEEVQEDTVQKETDCSTDTGDSIKNSGRAINNSDTIERVFIESESNLSADAKVFYPQAHPQYQSNEFKTWNKIYTRFMQMYDENKHKTIKMLTKEAIQTLNIISTVVLEEPALFDIVMKVTGEQFLVYLPYDSVITTIVETIHKKTLINPSFTYHGMRILKGIVQLDNVIVKENGVRNIIMRTIQKQLQAVQNSLQVRRNINVLPLMLFAAELYIQLEVGNQRLALIGQAIAQTLEQYLEADFIPAREKFFSTVKILKLIGSYLDKDRRDSMDRVINCLESQMIKEDHNLDERTRTFLQNFIQLRNTGWGVTPEETENSSTYRQGSSENTAATQGSTDITIPLHIDTAMGGGAATQQFQGMERNPALPFWNMEKAQALAYGLLESVPATTYQVMESVPATRFHTPPMQVMEGAHALPFLYQPSTQYQLGIPNQQKFQAMQHYQSNLNYQPAMTFNPDLPIQAGLPYQAGLAFQPGQMLQPGQPFLAAQGNPASISLRNGAVLYAPDGSVMKPEEEQFLQNNGSSLASPSVSSHSSQSEMDEAYADFLRSLPPTNRFYRP